MAVHLRIGEWTELQLGRARTLLVFPEGHTTGGWWLAVKGPRGVRVLLEHTGDEEGSPKGLTQHAPFEERIRRGECCLSAPGPVTVSVRLSGAATGFPDPEATGNVATPQPPPGLTVADLVRGTVRVDDTERPIRPAPEGSWNEVARALQQQARAATPEELELVPAAVASTSATKPKAPKGPFNFGGKK